MIDQQKCEEIIKYEIGILSVRRTKGWTGGMRREVGYRGAPHLKIFRGFWEGVKELLAIKISR